MKRTLLALDRIQERLENELDATEVRSERDAGYRAPEFPRRWCR